VPQGYENKTPTKHQAQDTPVKAIVSRQICRNLIESGAVRPVAVIARASKVDGSNVCQMLDRTPLSPDIIEAILDGKGPSGLSPVRLNGKWASPSWDGQRHDLGVRVPE